MNDERYKDIMNQLGMPNSQSLQTALRQVANEVGQELKKENTELRAQLEEQKEDTLLYKTQYGEEFDRADKAEAQLARCGYTMRMNTFL
jgi:antitoxin component of RelBE/YafQ-DinJ toxin-antitoxin module